MSLLTVNDLRVEYRRADGTSASPAVDGISFALEAGQTLALVGESGSGKSTTGFALLGLLPDNARVTATQMSIAGVDLRGASERQWQHVRGARIAMVFQDAMSALNPLMSIGDQVAEAVALHQPGNRAQHRLQALALLRKVRIPEAERRMHEYPHRLSGGMRQRVVIAMALAGNPAVLIADEPTTALDVTIQAQVLALLSILQAETGMAILLITHDLGVVAQMADRVMVLRDGQCLESQAVNALFRAPQHPYTRQLLASRFADGGAA